jgi:hypothetical protein
VDHSEVSKLTLRSDEPLVWFNYLQKGGEIQPLSVLKANF